MVESPELIFEIFDSGLYVESDKSKAIKRESIEALVTTSFELTYLIA